MKLLFLVRHGEADGNAQENDIDRNLTLRGQDEVAQVAHAMKERFVHADILMCSTAQRSRVTSLLLAQSLGFPTDKIKIESDIYRSDVNTLLDLIALQDNNLNSMVITGHNPTLTELAALLAMDFNEMLPTAGCVGLNFRAKTWEELVPSSAKLTFFISPDGVGER